MEKTLDVGYGQNLVGGENFLVDTGRYTGTLGLVFSSSNRCWYLHSQRLGWTTNTMTTEPSQVMDLFPCLTVCRWVSEGTDVACPLTSCHTHSYRFTVLSRRGCEE